MLRRVVLVVVSVAAAGCNGSATGEERAVDTVLAVLGDVSTVSDVSTTAAATTPVLRAPLPTVAPAVLDSSTVEFVEVTLSDPPPFPVIIGYDPVGDVQTETVRVFGLPEVASPSFTTSVNRCEQGVWIVRWRTLGPADLPVTANMAPGGILDQVVPSDLAPADAGLRGHLGGSHCYSPVFYLATQNGLVDVVIDRQYYAISVDEVGTVDEPAVLDPLVWQECNQYFDSFDLPLTPCDTGLTVRYAQQQLAEIGLMDGVDADGFYGPLTAEAVAEFQRSVDLVADGNIGRNTWNLLMFDVFLPGYDEDGNNIITPNEIVGD